MTFATSGQPSAYLLGAFDRFNYGDLLFPLIVRNELAARSPHTHCAVHALIESDLSPYGALKTQSLKALYEPEKLKPGDTVIFAGGGTVGVDWTYMYANLLGKTGNAVLYYAQRLFGESTVNALSRRHFSARAPFPWVAGPEDFPVPVNVAYNAVGGSEFAKLTTDIQKATLQRLEKAAFLSVRDAETQRLFSPLEQHQSVELAPDSAILMSEQFPLGWLETQASAPHQQRLDAAPYVCFQANLNYTREHAEQIVHALEAIHERDGLRALLLPIGRYVGLDDQIALRTIRDRMRTPAEIVSDQASIFEIMLTIARAKLFLGTSLHGNITSQSFAVPHLGLSDRPCKVDFYLETWDLPEQARCVPITEVAHRLAEVLAVPAATRMQKRDELIAISHKNFADLFKACGLISQTGNKEIIGNSPTRITR